MSTLPSKVTLSIWGSQAHGSARRFMLYFVPTTSMPTEADTCRTYIVPKLHAAGWEDDYIAEQRVIAPGRIVLLGRKHMRQDSRRPDYILFLRRNYPIAVVEAKVEYRQPGDGLQRLPQGRQGGVPHRQGEAPRLLQALQGAPQGLEEGPQEAPFVRLRGVSRLKPI